METVATAERVYVWQVPVRITHWVNTLAIFVLSATGFYIGEPFLRGGVYLMGWMRATHLLFGYVLLAGVGARVYWAFAGNRYASWRNFFPYLTASGRRGMWRTLAFYLFLRREPPGEVGHNDLAAFVYSIVWALMIFQIVTGFALLGLYQTGWWQTAFGWVFLIASAPVVRMAHHLGMWLLLGFVVHHVYSAALMDIEECNGLLLSIVSGCKYVRRAA